MGQPEEPNFHGMVLVGEKRAYLYHLPMFHSPHDYQAVFEVSLTSDDADALPAYRRDRIDNPPGGASRPDTDSRMYGFKPKIDADDADPLTDLFILSDLVTPSDPHDPKSPPIREAFIGTIFRGHFETFHQHEKGGPAILSDVMARVLRPVLFRKFDPHATRPPRSEYFLFGGVGELFLAHAISCAPDFDQILEVELEGVELDDLALRGALRVTVPDRSDEAKDRLATGDEVAAEVGVAGEQRAVTLRVRTQHYFETDDLESGPHVH